MSYILSPEWEAVRTRFQDDIGLFCTEVLGIEVTPEQSKLLSLVQRAGSRTAYVPEKQRGNSEQLYKNYAVVALWHLLCFNQSNTRFFKSHCHQLRLAIWRNVTALLDSMMWDGKYPQLRDDVQVTAEVIHIKGHHNVWKISLDQITDNAVALAGQHDLHYLAIVDYAQSVRDAALDVILGGLTFHDNRILLTINKPVIKQESLTDKVLKQEDDYWDLLAPADMEFHFWQSAKLDPLKGSYLNIDPNQIYNGSSLFAGAHDDFGYVLSVEVGGGVGRNDSVIVVAKVWGNAHWGDCARRAEVVDIPLCKNKNDLHELTGIIDQCLSMYPNISIVLNDNGVGRGLGQHLKSKGICYKSVNWGGRCFNNSNDQEFANKRSHAIVCMSRAVCSDRFKIMTEEHKPEMLNKIKDIPLIFDTQARYKVLSRDELCRKNIPMPDINVLAYFFLEGVTYTVANAEEFA